MLEYDLISTYYGNTRTARSNVPFINHIDEGLIILKTINASEIAEKAFCLHPFFQSDIDLLKNVFNYDILSKVEPVVLLTTIEYRHIANSYLSNRVITCLNDIILSPLKDVNDMLVADKVQNFKDFELYHKATHERSSELTEYFNNWIRKLNIDYQHLKSKIS